MDKSKTTKAEQKAAPIPTVEKVKKVEPTKQEKLEYHLWRLEWNFISKQEARAIFASLFRE